MFDHEKLDVYRISLEFVGWAYRLSSSSKGMDRPARDQLLRASQSITLNIAEGNGRRPTQDRRRFLDIACGSALECAAVLDVLQACETLTQQQAHCGKLMLQRIVSMLIKLSTVYDRVCEDRGQTEYEYRCAEYEYECEYE